MKEVAVKVQGDLVVPQATLGEAGLSGRLRLIIQPGEIRILPEPTTLHEPMFTHVVSTRRATLWPPASPSCQTLR